MGYCIREAKVYIDWSAATTYVKPWEAYCVLMFSSLTLTALLTSTAFASACLFIWKPIPVWPFIRLMVVASVCASVTVATSFNNNLLPSAFSRMIRLRRSSTPGCFWHRGAEKTGTTCLTSPQDRSYCCLQSAGLPAQKKYYKPVIYHCQGLPGSLFITTDQCYLANTGYVLK